MDGILSAIGRTPLVRLSRVLPGARFDLYGKLEFLNPGGSIKDRPALHILTHALDEGVIRPGSVVVESSSGNMGVGLAQACRFLGLRFVCVVDPKTANQNIRVLQAYGAEIDFVKDPDPVTGEFLDARIRRVNELCDAIPGAFWPNQYDNRHNPGAHYHTTMREVAEELEGRVDYLFAATSTCGTVRGCGEFIRDNGLDTRLVAVDAVGSLIFSDQAAPRHIPGLGAGIKPPHCDLSLLSRFVHVTDMDCVVGCRRLLATESILAGGSSGGVLSAVVGLADEIPEGSRCVVILCDRGERYLDTIYDDDWVHRHCGEIESLTELQPLAKTPLSAVS